MTSSEITWEAPPGGRRSGPGGGQMAAFVDLLKTRPGEWARYPHASSSSAAAAVRLKQRYGCEATSRTVDGEPRVYARWVA